MVRRTKDGNVSGKCPGSVSLAEREIYILSPWAQGKEKWDLASSSYLWGSCRS